jgi:hypothetical protein
MKFRSPSPNLLLVPFVILLASCDRLNVEKVRQGTLDFDTTKTLGDAFGKSDVISHGKWSGFAADDGSQVVEFSGAFEGLQQAMDEIFAEIRANPQAATLAALGSGGEMGALGLGFLLNTPLRIDSCDYQIQFLLSKRDDSFEIGASELKARITNTQSGEAKDYTFNDEESKVLEAIYDNDKSAVALYVLAQAMQTQMAEGLLQQLGN